MGFQTKLILTYSIFIIILVIILGTLFYRHSTSIFQANSYSNLSVVSDKMSQQLDNLIHPMDFVSTDLLSDSQFISGLTSLARVNRSNIKNLYYINDAKQVIDSKIVTYSNNKNFYRVSVFNDIGDFLSSNFKTRNLEELRTTIHELKWKKIADKAMGKIVILPPFKDPWGLDGIKAFAVVRSVQWPSSGIGYIEVQNPYDNLQKIFEVPNRSATKVVAVAKSGDVFYNEGVRSKQLLRYYSGLALSVKGSPSILRNKITGKDEIVVGSRSAYTGISIVIAQDKSILFNSLSFTAKATLMIGLIIILISIVYIYLFTKRLVKPIRALKQNIENTELQNLPEEMVFESSNNEIEALNNSFQRLRERLNEAISHEIKAQSLQMKANFDSLQAQVNPHFIYNILNVLSNKGIENGDEEICEICDSIAGMLRYSTSTLKRSAKIGDELEHVRNYLLLMKKRYEHRLEFVIDVDASIHNEPIPKIILQQIVENSVNHSFEKGQRIVKIKITGYVSDNWWYIDISDNGQGFEIEILNDLRQRMESMKKDIITGESKTGFAIGGMGLINTYGRLVLFYNNKFIFTLKNLDEGGAQVTIGSVMGLSDEGDERC